MDVRSLLKNKDLHYRRRAAVLAGVIVGLPLILLGIYGSGNYGVALFVLVPFVVGVVSTIALGFDRKISIGAGLWASCWSLLALALILLLLAMEGVICLAMAAPLAIGLAWIGALVGVVLLRRLPPAGMLLFIGALTVAASVFSFAERDREPELDTVVTSVIVAADPEAVWEEVVAFSPITEPPAWYFRAGISYPVDARIEGRGVGALRYCNFNTGSFVEPITTWDRPRLLAFDVEQQPEPLRELSFWDVDSPHLHDYFVSHRGQFELIARADGTTELKGTTWYTHRIFPAWYWRPWSQFIVSRIHRRVLEHIKRAVEG